ncbi:hypothetical protein M514_02134 [Trichuris suis]|uniref:Uncharacterized protein n=1 Tax=Trichuris suis TaxID=68888 RepID=A0A085MI31_9BILA|nr:hypothetical protein M513_02134 [Trichuris suis]KFD61695.1 hypothetical protein M514_02134 [Trichuris suis]
MRISSGLLTLGISPSQDVKSIQPAVPLTEHHGDLSRRSPSRVGQPVQALPSYLSVNMNMMPSSPGRVSSPPGSWLPIVRTPEPHSFQPNVPQQFNQLKLLGGAANLNKPPVLGDNVAYQEKKSANPFLVSSLSHQLNNPWEQPPLNFASPSGSHWQYPFKAEQAADGIGIQSMTPPQMGSLPFNYQQNTERSSGMPDPNTFGFPMPLENGQVRTAEQSSYYSGPSPSSYNNPSQDMQNNFHSVQAGYNDILNAMYPMNQERRGEEYAKSDFETFGTVGANMYEGGLSKEKRANFPDTLPFMRFSESDPMPGNAMQAPYVPQKSPDNGNPFPAYPFSPLPQYPPTHPDGSLLRENSQVPDMHSVSNSNHPSKYRESYPIPDGLLSTGPQTSEHYQPSAPFRFPLEQPSWTSSDLAGGNAPSSDNSYRGQTFRSEANDQASVPFFNSNPTSEETADALSPLTLQVRLANSTMENPSPANGSESYDNEADEEFEEKEKADFEEGFKLKKMKENTNLQKEESSGKAMS